MKHLCSFTLKQLKIPFLLKDYGLLRIIHALHQHQVRGFLGLPACSSKFNKNKSMRGFLALIKLFRRTALRHGLAEQDCTSINSRSQSILSF